MSNFSFSHNVFHSYISIVCQNAVLCGNGLTLYKTTKFWTGPRQQNKCDLNLKFALGWVENIVGKENAGYQHFLLFLQCFQMATFSGSLKVGIVW